MYVKLTKLIQTLFCKHNYGNLVFKRNIGGDEMRIHYVKEGLAKSEWVCKQCGRVVYKPYRVATTPKEKPNND